MSTPQLPRTGWNVTSQQESTEVVNGTATRGYLVYFTTALGNSGSVFVPFGSYSPPNVKAIVDERAALVDAVSALASNPATSAQ
jgi:hypothetical protein